MTFPKSLLREIGVDIGDSLVVSVKDDKVVLKPRKREALDTLSELQRVIKESGVKESEIQKQIEAARVKSK